MQLTLIIGIVFAIGAGLFALQNVAPVTVALAFWSFEGSLAVVLLMALGLGAIIAGLVSSPAMIRRQWATVRLGRQVAELEHKLLQQEKRNAELEAELARVNALATPPVAETAAAEEKPYVGLRALIAGGEDTKPPGP